MSDCESHRCRELAGTGPAASASAAAAAAFHVRVTRQCTRTEAPAVGGRRPLPEVEPRAINDSVARCGVGGLVRRVPIFMPALISP